MGTNILMTMAEDGAMARTGDPNKGFLADVARARANDGNTPGGLERVVRMAQAAARVHNATTLGEIRPDLADEDVDFHADAVIERRRMLNALMRPTGPRPRLSPLGVVVKRSRIGLDPAILPE